MAVAARTSRLSIRIDTDRKAVIAKAAERQGTTISDFVLDQAYQMASVLLADESPVALSRKQVAFLYDVLDRPPIQSVTAIRKLLTERTVLDG